MRLVTYVRDGKLSFDIKSLEDSTLIEVVTPKGKSIYFQNEPKGVTLPKKGWMERRFLRRRSDFTYIPNIHWIHAQIRDPKCWERYKKYEIVKQIDTQQDFIHYLMYSADKREEYAIPLDKQYPLWKIVKWKMFKNDIEFGNDALVYDFVNNRFVRFTPIYPARFWQNDQMTYLNDQTQFNCKPLVELELALTTAIIKRDGELFEPPAPSAPPAPPPAYFGDDRIDRIATLPDMTNSEFMGLRAIM